MAGCIHIKNSIMMCRLCDVSIVEESSQDNKKIIIDHFSTRLHQKNAGEILQETYRASRFKWSFPEHWIRPSNVCGNSSNSTNWCCVPCGISQCFSETQCHINTPRHYIRLASYLESHLEMFNGIVSIRR